MPHYQPLQFLRDDDITDLNEPEAYGLEDLLYQVRALTHDAETLPFSFANDEDVLIWALAILCESPLARSFAFDARFEDWAIELDDCEDGHFIAEPQIRTLILPRCAPSAVALGRSPYMRQLFLLEFCRGLRAIWHLDSGVPSSHNLTIKDQIVWNRLVRADLDVMSLTVAWDLREADLPDLWRHLIGSDLGDLAISYAATLERHPQGLDLPVLLRQVYLQWLAADLLLEPVDHRTLERLDRGLTHASRVYGTRRIQASEILRLTAMAEDKSYLEGLATHLLADPELARMPDQVNAAHLAHLQEDLTAIRITQAGFRDQDLARRIFPDLPADGSIDTLA